MIYKIARVENIGDRMNNDEKNDIRASRKDEHINMFLQHPNENHNLFCDIVLQNNALPEIDFEEISTSHIFLNKSIDLPIMINAVTGGTDYTAEINEKLAILARDFNIPIAVGSQTIAIQNKQAENSFKIVREINKEGIVIANIGANNSYEDACRAIDMIQADALQLHLNTPQEICMQEGERHFKGTLANITQIVKQTKIPVIVKEVGFGISYEVARKLHQVGVEYIDVGGKGGTNFIAIEAGRNKENDYSFLKQWGIPTALSLLECRKSSSNMKIICSGGITKAEEVVKAMCMGAAISGISGLILRELLDNGFEAATATISKIKYEVKVFMLLLGAQNVEKLAKTPYQLKGELYQLYKQKFL